MPAGSVRDDVLQLPAQFFIELAAAPDLESALETTARWIRAVLDVDRVTLTLVDTQTHLRLIALEGNKAIPLDMAVPIEGTLVGRVFSRRRPEICNDMSVSSDLDCMKLSAGGLRSCLDVPLVNGSDCYGTLNAASRLPDAFTQSHLTRIHAFGSWVATNIRVHRQMQELKDLADRDPLTGLLNRRAFMAAAEPLARSGSGLPFGLALIDLDHFKAVNDRFGHAAGDMVLEYAAKLLVDICRPIDLVSRLGGEEFGIALPGIGPADTKAVLNRYLAGLAGCPTIFEGKRIPVTASVGAVHVYTGGIDVTRLLQQADKAMYRAKRAGRNRIEYVGFADARQFRKSA
jgi:diguanylate cyclase (GGDEF)-like protein